MNYKIIGLSALINAFLTILLSLVSLPLIILGPFIGGIFASYFHKGFEDYKEMDFKDGAVLGAISGLIGGFLVTLLSIIGIGNISLSIGLFLEQLGSSGNFIVTGYITLEFMLIISFIFSLIGGIIGVIIKK